jgi:urea carboxylase
VNFTGDMPVILTQDGPSLGGFVCPATIPSSELWKVGQVRPHDEIRFRQISIEDAYAAALRTDALVAAVRNVARGKVAAAAAAATLDKFTVRLGGAGKTAGGPERRALAL